MIASLVLAWAAGCGGAPPSAGTAAERGPQDTAPLQAHLDAGRLGEAWAALDGIDDPLLRSRARADVLLRCRNFRAALASARDALEEQGADAHLLLAAARSALWLRDGSEARRHLEALAPVAAAMEDPGARAWWLAEQERLLAAAEELERAQDARGTKLRRARLGSLGLVGAVLLGLFGLARGATGTRSAARSLDP